MSMLTGSPGVLQSKVLVKLSHFQRLLTALFHFSPRRHTVQEKTLTRFHVCYNQGPNFDDMSSLFPCEIDDAIQYINLAYGVQAPKIVIL